MYLAPWGTWSQKRIWLVKLGGNDKIMRRIPTVQELEHIAAKFILNLPKEELVEERLGFHF